ncbi:MAG: tripartite tricarboxylate transporter substrate binding protein, partial [Proteobacteria bacterium]|nr:tripartite tricarboxylate transporter substrate binding protein [Pseudomonadota bacterium]
PAGLPTIESGKVRALAIGSAQRVPQLPNLPTLTESGVKDSEVYAFQGLLGPAGMPQDVVAKLNGALNAALKAPVVVQRMHDYGMEAQPGTPQQFFDMSRAEAKRWGPVIKSAGVKLD